MTLWPISDVTTVEVMLNFYDRPHASSPITRSRFWMCRRGLALVKLRKEKGLVYAVDGAGPFMMSSQGISQRPRLVRHGDKNQKILFLISEYF